MVNRGIRILTAALLMLTGIFLVPQASYGASASDVRMEQVSVCMPQVKVYLMGEDVQDVDFQQITAGFFPEGEPAFGNDNEISSLGCKFNLFMAFITNHKRKAQFVFQGGQSVAYGWLG